LLNPECKQQSQIGSTHYSLHLKFLKFLKVSGNKENRRRRRRRDEGRYKLQTLESSSEEINKDIAPKFSG